jgi:predicted nucleotidyltransferase
MKRVGRDEIIMSAKEVLSAYDSEISYAFLFGSALTQLRSDSDIDILVGGDLDFESRMDLTAKLVLVLKRNVDLVQAREARCEVVLKALSKGMPILIKDTEALKRDYLKNFRLYDDTTNLRRLKLSKIKREYARG